MLGRAIPASQSRRVAPSGEKIIKILFRNHDLFLAQKIEVGVTAGPRVDDGGEVSGNRVGSMACVPRGKRK
jgi:hypothetical protein